jgi:hypothetical protein
LLLTTSFSGNSRARRFQDGTLLFEDPSRPLIAFVKNRKFNAIWQRAMFQFLASSGELRRSWPNLIAGV